MFKKILLCTDLSSNSKQAFSVAKDIAIKFDAEIDLIAVVSDIAETALFSVIEQPNLISEDIQKKILDEVKKDLDKLSNEFGYKKIRSVVVEAKGPVHNTIVNYAHTNNINLIVMSSNGRAGFRRLVMGSVSEKVLREAKCPVLIVPCYATQA